MDNNSVRKLGRRKAGTYGKPHKYKRAVANRASRSILKRLLRGVRNTLLGSDE